MLQNLKKIIKKINISSENKNLIRRIIRPTFLYKLTHNTKPISNYHGFDRGRPIDRYYIENFIEDNKEYIHGTCLELLNNDYTLRFGMEKVIKSDVLDIDESNKNANIFGDLRDLKNVADNKYDCIILTQVFQFIDNVDAAISECYRILKKDGILLATLPSLSRIDCVSGIDGDYWRFTKASAKYLFTQRFHRDQIKIESKGNARSGSEFYLGLAQEDISRKILRENDENFPLIITVKAIKQ